MTMLFGVFDPTDWQLSINGLAAYAAIDQASGQAMSLTHPQLSWASGVNPDGSPRYQRLFTPRLEADRLAGRASLLTWLSFNLGHPEQNLLFNLPAILSGKHDAYIRQFALDAAAWGHPFFLRYNAEMNGWWEGPFSEADSNGSPLNGNSPGQFAQMWRYVHNLVAPIAPNILWHWCPNPVDPNPNTASPTGVKRLGSFYPGDEFVDVVGIDLYNKGGNSWLTFQQCLEGDGANYGNSWAAINAIAPTKPWLLGEVGCVDAPGNKPAWILDMFNIIPKNYPSILGICWYNWDDGSGHWILTEPPGAITAWGQGASGSAWAKAKQFQLPTDKTSWTRYVYQSQQSQLSAAQAQVLLLQQQLVTAQNTSSLEAGQIQSLQNKLDQTTQALSSATSSMTALQATVDQVRQEISGLVTFSQGKVT